MPNRISTGVNANESYKFVNSTDDEVAVRNFVAKGGSQDFFLEVTKGNITGHSNINIVGNSPDINSTEETVWDFTDKYVYLTDDTTLYASSSDNGDTQDIVITGLDSDYLAVTRTVTLSGQTQVELSGQMFRVFSAYVNDSTTPAGDVYIAESDTLSGGVPTTDSKIKAKILQGKNITRMGIYTVPAGKSLIVTKLRFGVGKGKDARIFANIRYLGGVWLCIADFNIYELSDEYDILGAGFTFPEKTDMEFSATSSVNSEVFAAVDATVIDN